MITTVSPLVSRAHPRMLCSSAEELARVRSACATDPLRGWIYRRLQDSAVALLDRPVLHYEKIGRRILDVSREAVHRIWLLALLSRLDGDDRFALRAEKEMRALAAFSDWNPDHFLDTAEMTAALAVGYDWLHEKLSEDTRARVREAIIAKGIEPSFATRQIWVSGTSNWTQVCHAGLVLGALAIAENAPELAERVVARAMENIRLPGAEYGPDGAYPEGPGYWAYGTTWHTILLAALESATGRDLRGEIPDGMLKSIHYLAHVTTPTGRTFNYADNLEPRRAEPAIFWLAARSPWPGLAIHERTFLARLAEEAGDEAEKIIASRFTPLLLLWLSPPSAENAAPLPLTWSGNGVCPVAMMRSAWHDKNAIFAGLKGGSPNGPHGQMDSGVFMIEADGVRWACDLGQVDYHHYESQGVDLWNLRSQTGRWSVLGNGPWAHNIVTFDEEMPRPDGFASFIQFSADAPVPHAVVDSTAGYPTKARRILRGVALPPDAGVLVQDEIEGVTARTEIRWALLTRAGVRIEGMHAFLAEAGRELKIVFECTHTARLSVITVDQLRAPYDSHYPEHRLLLVRCTLEPGDDFRLRTWFQSGSLAGSMPALPATACAQWAETLA